MRNDYAIREELAKGGLKNGKLKKVASALNKASKLHKKQSKIIKKHIKDMRRGRS